MTTTWRWNKDDHDRKVLSAAQSFHSGQNVHIDSPPITTFDG